MRTVMLLCGLVWLIADCSLGDDHPPKNAATQEADMPHLNVPMKTLGGRQFWGDVLFFHEYRIQRNVFTGHYRLLNGKDVRLAWGSLDECQQKLDQQRADLKLPPMQGKAVILLHGITRSSKHMAKFREPFEKAGYSVFAMDYPSTRGTIQESSEYLQQVIKNLQGITEINFVVHSMGGLVVRTYLSEHAPRDPRIHRMVMIGSPNNGANLANLLSDNMNAVFKPIFGPAGQQLVVDTDGYIAKLPKPDFEFAVVAGGRGEEKGFNPLIPGDDDGIVSVESTRLPGASDFLLVAGGIEATHTFLPAAPIVIESCVRFIQTGALRADGMKSPIMEPAK